MVATQGSDVASEFDAATAVARVRGASMFTGEVDAGWTVGDKPNGGYLLAMIARACGEALASAGSSHRDPVAATAHYLHAPDVGPVELVCEVLRVGRGASQVRCVLRQGGRGCVDATLTLGTLAPAGSAPTWTARDVVDVAPFDRCVRIPAVREGAPFVVSIMDRSDLRLDPAVLGFARGEPSGEANLRGWIAFADGRPADPLGLLFFCDALPPATFELVRTGWVPTLSLTVYVRARPAPGPLRITQSAHAIDDGRVDETCEVWDSTGRLVAQATQLAAIRVPDGAL
ncbi:MAG: thioesterase family protein [Actinobacteria bacterium]|nr:thioesterase family protein [Actinomycetota bacterium]